MSEPTLTLDEMRALMARWLAMAQWIEGDSGQPMTLTVEQWLATLRGMATHHGLTTKDTK